VLEAGDKQMLCAIGVSEPNVKTLTCFVGWLPGTLSYHADNGQYVLVYLSTSASYYFLIT